VNDLAQGNLGRFAGSVGGRFGPEIGSIDQTMGEPERAMMGMIVRLIGHVVHWPIASHFHAAGAVERVKIDVGSACEVVFREGLAAHVDGDFIGQFLDFHGGLRRGGAGDDSKKRTKRAGGAH